MARVGITLAGGARQKRRWMAHSKVSLRHTRMHILSPLYESLLVGILKGDTPCFSDCRSGRRKPKCQSHGNASDASTKR